MATITTQELKFDKSLNTTKALAILDINASKVQALYDSGQYSRVIELFKTALHDRTKKWGLRKQAVIGEDKDNVLHIHEAYQYLLKKCVDDVARNTMANEVTEKLSLEEVNAKYSKLSKEMNFLPPLERKTDTDPEHGIPKVWGTREMNQLTMHTMPKKLLLKTASESKLQLKNVRFDVQEENKLKQKTKWQKVATPSPFTKSFSDSLIKIKDFDLREGSTFMASRRGVKGVEEESEKMEKFNLKPSILGSNTSTTTPKKPFAKSASESKLRLTPREDQSLESMPKNSNSGEVSDDNKKEKLKNNPSIPIKKKFSKSASESKLNIPKKVSVRRKSEAFHLHEPINEEKNEDNDNSSEENDSKDRRDQIDLLKNQLSKTLPKSASGSRNDLSKNQGRKEEFHYGAEGISTSADDDYISESSDTVKFDFSQELKRRLHTSSRGSRGSKGNAQDGGTPTEMEALRMARALKWMAKLESCNQR